MVRDVASWYVRLFASAIIFRFFGGISFAILKSNHKSTAYLLTCAHFRLRVRLPPPPYIYLAVRAPRRCGNVMLAKGHPDFPSDVVLCLAAAGASIVLASKSNGQLTMPILDFMQHAMDQHTIVLSVFIPYVRLLLVFILYKKRKYPFFSREKVEGVSSMNYLSVCIL